MEKSHENYRCGICGEPLMFSMLANDSPCIMITVRIMCPKCLYGFFYPVSSETLRKPLQDTLDKMMINYRLHETWTKKLKGV